MKPIEDSNLPIFAVFKCRIEFKLYRQTVRMVFKVCIFVDLYLLFSTQPFVTLVKKLKSVQYV